MSFKALWYAKHRPISLDEYVWRDPAQREQIARWIAEGSLPHLALLGPTGTGKTALARLIIGLLGVPTEDVLELNASKDNNTDTVRNRIHSFCETGGWSGLKIVFLDEADNFTFQAQQMLRKLMDDYADEVRFIFTGNFERRLHEPVLGRVTTLHIEALDYESFVLRLAQIEAAEGIALDDSTVTLIEEIGRASYPNMRQAINTMEQCTWDDALHNPDESPTRGAADWETPVRQAVLEGTSVGELRKIVDGISQDDVESVFSYLYRISDDFGDTQTAMKMLVALGEGLRAHPHVGFPHMNLAITVIRMMAIRSLAK